MKMKNIVWISFLLIGMNSQAQTGKLKKADRYYEKLSYAYAADLYEQLLGSEVETPTMKVNLARSYYYMGDMPKAEEALSKIVNSAVAQKDDVFLYAQALKQNGKIKESDDWMNKFRNKAPNDIRGKSYSDNSDYFKRIVAQGKKFEIKNLAINTSFADFGGYPTASGEQAFIVSSRRKRAFVKNEWSWDKGRFLDLYSTSKSATFELENPSLMTRKTNTLYHEGPLAFSPDGQTVYFTRNNIAKGKQRRDEKGIQNLKLYRASLDQEGKWGKEEVLPFNSKDYSVGHPTISADGKTMFFASDMPGGVGGADLYKIDIHSDGTFGQPTNLGKEVNTEGQDMFPWVGKDGTLFFASNGRIGLGGMDVFAVFPKNNAYGNMMNLGLPINSENDDFAFVMSKDGQHGYFSSNREGGQGDDDIYSFKLIAPLKLNLNMEGVVTDKTSKMEIPNATVQLLDGKGNVLQTTTADNKGKYTFGLEPDLSYQVRATKDKYFENKVSFTTTDLPDNSDLLKKNLQLERDPGLGLYTFVKDAKTGDPVKGVRLSITDVTTGKLLVETITPETGDNLKSILDHKIGDKVTYRIDIFKDGYFPKSETFTTIIDKTGIINTQEFIKGGLSLDKEVKDLSEMVKINPINFDLGKFNIRPDAKTELDKIVEIMIKYPLMEVELGSHTDCRGSITSNNKLSDQRAKSSADYIKSKISNPSRIYGKGYGESKLLNDCGCEGAEVSDCSEEEHAKNRRTEFIVIKTGAENLKVVNAATKGAEE